MAGSDTSREDDELEDAKEAFRCADEAWNDNYVAALDDFRFAQLHEHWPEVIKRQREMDCRPTLTIPKLPAFINQIVNDGRQNKPAISCYPVDSDADPQTAEIIDGLFRHIEQASDADVAYDTALEHAVTGGFGWIKVNTRYAGDDTFDQDIVIEAVPNAFSIRPDPNSTAADSSDWNDAFELCALPKAKFEKLYPDAEAVSFDGKGDVKQHGEEDVQIAYRWKREVVTRQIVALSAPQLDPTVPPDVISKFMSLVPQTMIVEMDTYTANKDLFDALGVEILGKPRDVPSHKVTQRVLSGADVLKTVDWAGKFIPIIPVYGKDINIEGRRYLQGIVRAAKDEQRRFNYNITSATELVALAPKAPFIGKKGTFDTDAAKWATANIQTHAYIEYDTEAPARQMFAGVPVGELQMAANASDNIKSILGMFDASLGAKSNETSGRAILARQHEGDTGSFHFIDNVSRAIRHTARVALDLIPKVYSVPRVIRIIGPDDEAKTVQVTGTVNGQPMPAPLRPSQVGEPVPQQPQPGQQPQQPGVVDGSENIPSKQIENVERIYQLDLGRYDLVVKAGPSFSTQRQEFVQLATELIRAQPQLASVLLDLVVKNYDIPDADEIVDRIRAMQPGQSPELAHAKQAIGQLQQKLGMMTHQLQAAGADRSLEDRELDIKTFEAETDRFKAMLGKDGAQMPPDQLTQVVMASLAQILNSPELIGQMMGQGAPPPAPPGPQGFGGPQMGQAA